MITTEIETQPVAGEIISLLQVDFAAQGYSARTKFEGGEFPGLTVLGAALPGLPGSIMKVRQSDLRELGALLLAHADALDIFQAKQAAEKAEAGK